VDTKVVALVATEVVVMDTTMKKEHKQTNKIDVDEVVIVEEVVFQIVQMLNITTAENMDTPKRIAIDPAC